MNKLFIVSLAGMFAVAPFAANAVDTVATPNVKVDVKDTKDMQDVHDKDFKGVQDKGFYDKDFKNVKDGDVKTNAGYGHSGYVGCPGGTDHMMKDSSFKDSGYMDSVKKTDMKVDSGKVEAPVKK